MSLSFLITIVPVNRFIINAIMIVICCCVTNQSGTYSNNPRPGSTALIHIPCVFRLSGKYHRVNGSISMALSHIFCVLRRPGKNAKEYGSIRNALLHISCVFRLSGVLLLILKLFQAETYLFIPFRPRQGSKFMDRKNNTMHRLPQGVHFI